MPSWKNGTKVVRASLQALLDVADSAATTLASGVATRHISWLQLSSLPSQLLHTIQDLSFNDKGLFSQLTLGCKAKGQQGHYALPLGICIPMSHRRPFRPASLPLPCA